MGGRALYGDAMTASIPEFEAKIVGRAQLPASVADLKRPLVLTNGVFDILHRGHVNYLAQARALGASLVVAVNSDTSVRVLGKGDDRPINPESDRAALLAALSSVDLVTIFEERMPLAVIDIVRPDVYVKGGDYDIELLPETRAVRALGGRVQAIPFVHDRSTSRLLARVRGTGE